MKKLFAKAERPGELRIPFKYEHLQSNEIRLLRLHPSSGLGLARPLSGSLKTIRLQDDNSSVSTKFEALSYFWGNEEADRTLSIDNTPLSIKPNLETALRELSKGKVERLLWIDAICINQNDTDERNAQVRMMSSIYRSAARVIIWIGPRWTGGKSSAAEVIRDFANRQKDGATLQQLLTFLYKPDSIIKIEKNLRMFNEPGAIDYPGAHWPALVDFFDRPWWRRVWVRYVLSHSYLSFKVTVHPWKPSKSRAMTNDVPKTRTCNVPSSYRAVRR